MKFPKTAEYTTFDAQKLLVKKLIGVIESSENVVSDCWSVQILHILCQTNQIAETVVNEYQKLPPCLKKNTIAILTITEKAPYVYTSYPPQVTAPICPVKNKEKTPLEIQTILDSIDIDKIIEKTLNSTTSSYKQESTSFFLPSELTAEA